MNGMTPEEQRAFIEASHHRFTKRRKLRLILNAMNLTALASMLGQMGDAELADVEKLLETSGKD